MAKIRPPKIPEKPVPVLADDQVRLLLAGCSGKDFHNRRDAAIIRLFLDTGMRLEGMGVLRYNPGDPELSDVDLRSRVVRITAKGRRELVLPIGAKTARDLDRYLRVRTAHPLARRVLAIQSPHVINRSRSMEQGTRGAAVFQPYRGGDSLTKVPQPCTV